MKNKKLSGFLIASTAFLFTSVFSFAQGTYIKAGGGYGIGVNRTPVNSYFQRGVLVFLGADLTEKNMVDITAVGNDVNVETVKGSFGQGGNFGLTAGYMFSKHIGAELGFSYFLGQELESKWDFPGNPNFLFEKRKANVFFINPSLVISAGTEGVNPYARIGALFGIAPKIKSTVDLSLNPNVLTIEDELTGGIATGFSAALGISYPVSSTVSIFGELAYNGLSYSPTDREITRVALNDVEEEITNFYTLANQPIKDIVSGDYSTKSFDATEQLAHSYSFSNLGLNVGLQFNFGGGGLARSR